MKILVANQSNLRTKLKGLKKIENNGAYHESHERLYNEWSREISWNMLTMD